MRTVSLYFNMKYLHKYIDLYTVLAKVYIILYHYTLTFTEYASMSESKRDLSDNE